MYPLTSRMNQALTPPRKNGVAGNAAAITVSAVQSAIDLRSLSGAATNPQNPTQSDGQKNGAVGGFLTVEADGADLFVLFGDTLAAVTGGNKPVAATVGAVNGSGVYTDAAGVAFKIANGTFQRFWLQDQRDYFMGFVGSAAGTMRLYQSSPPVP